VPPVKCGSAAPLSRGGDNLPNRIKRLLRSEKAEANYFSTVVFIFVAVIILAFIINLFAIISTKQQLDLAATRWLSRSSSPVHQFGYR
jgi:hypothetical protein